MRHAVLRPTSGGCVNFANLGVLMGPRPAASRGPRRVQPAPLIQSGFVQTAAGFQKKGRGGKNHHFPLFSAFSGILAALQGDTFATTRTK